MENREMPGLVILDLRSSFAMYEECHIPGAQFLHVETLRLSQQGIPCKMMPLPVLGAIFGQLGITVNTPVVTYTEEPKDHLSATYAAWSLYVTGNTRVEVLDGGFEVWRGEDRPITRTYPAIDPMDYEIRYDDSVFADWRYVRDRMGNPDVVLVDTRTRAMYNGTKGTTQRLGHIPGAILYNFFWSFTAGGVYRPLDEMRTRLERMGIVPDKEVITYCDTGREGSAVWFVLKCLLNYPRVRLYQASMTEWAAMPDLPMVTGNTPQGTGDAVNWTERRAA